MSKENNYNAALLVWLESLILIQYYIISITGKSYPCDLWSYIFSFVKTANEQFKNLFALEGHTVTSAFNEKTIFRYFCHWSGEKSIGFPL